MLVGEGVVNRKFYAFFQKHNVMKCNQDIQSSWQTISKETKGQK